MVILPSITRLAHRMRSSSYLSNIGWSGVNQFGIRISRLLATVFLSRYLSPSDYGIVAIALTTQNFLKVFQQNGIAEKLIQCQDDEVHALSNTAYTLNWCISIILFAVQSIAGFCAAE